MNEWNGMENKTIVWNVFFDLDFRVMFSLNHHHHRQHQRKRRRKKMFARICFQANSEPLKDMPYWWWWWTHKCNVQWWCYFAMFVSHSFNGMLCVSRNSIPKFLTHCFWCVNVQQNKKINIEKNETATITKSLKCISSEKTWRK